MGVPEMMNYQEMSDEQINHAVSDALSIPRGDDWCNSWEESGPIIEDNKISIFSDSDEQSDTDKDPTDYWWSAISFDTGCQHNAESNPLRAAMIVFLMMKEAD